MLKPEYFDFTSMSPMLRLPTNTWSDTPSDYALQKRPYIKKVTFICDLEHGTKSDNNFMPEVLSIDTRKKLHSRLSYKMLTQLVKTVQKFFFPHDVLCSLLSFSHLPVDVAETIAHRSIGYIHQ